MKHSIFRKAPTPLEIAAHELIGAQIALLTAHDSAERANAEVALYRTRIARLRLTVAELSAEAASNEAASTEAQP